MSPPQVLEGSLPWKWSCLSGEHHTFLTLFPLVEAAGAGEEKLKDKVKFTVWQEGDKGAGKQERLYTALVRQHMEYCV